MINRGKAREAALACTNPMFPPIWGKAREAAESAK